MVKLTKINSDSEGVDEIKDLPNSKYFRIEKELFVTPFSIMSSWSKALEDITHIP